MAAKWVFASVAVLLVTASIAVLTRLPREDIAPRSDHDGESPNLAPVPPQELATLDAIGKGLDQIAVDLRDLEKQAALMDARRDVDRLVTKYKPLDLPQQTLTPAN